MVHTFLSICLYILWFFFISIIFIDRLKKRPEHVVEAVIVLLLGVIVAIVCGLYFNGPYLLGYIK